jgi:hypothetical protein
MLKKIANIWAQMTESHEDAITAAWSLKRSLMFDERFDLFLDDFSDRVVGLSDRNIDLEQQLTTARTRASKNGCLALLAFGLIAVEILGVAIYFLPK